MWPQFDEAGIGSAHQLREPTARLEEVAGEIVALMRGGGIRYSGG
jgi:hypothetical protein